MQGARGLQLYGAGTRMPVPPCGAVGSPWPRSVDRAAPRARSLPAMGLPGPMRHLAAKEQAAPGRSPLTRSGSARRSAPARFEQCQTRASASSSASSPGSAWDGAELCSRTAAGSALSAPSSRTAAEPGAPGQRRQRHAGGAALGGPSRGTLPPEQLPEERVQQREREVHHHEAIQVLPHTRLPALGGSKGGTECGARPLLPLHFLVAPMGCEGPWQFLLPTPLPQSPVRVDVSGCCAPSPAQERMVPAVLPSRSPAARPCPCCCRCQDGSLGLLRAPGQRAVWTVCPRQLARAPCAPGADPAEPGAARRC